MTRKVKLQDRETELHVEPASICSIEVDGKVFIVPSAVGKIINELSGQIETEQEKKAFKEEDAKRIIEKSLAKLANALAGGYMGRYGDSFLKYNLGDSVSIADDIETDSGVRKTSFLNAVIGRMFEALKEDPEVENMIS